MNGYRFLDHLPPDFVARALRADVLAGLTGTPKSLPPRWFYDKQGSLLFEEITRLPEYYPTRAEREILTEHADELVAGADTVVELGSGSSEKTRLLLDSLCRQVPPETKPSYVASDVSEDALRMACAALAQDYPELRIAAHRLDFAEQLDRLPRQGRRVVAFLGGTIGNFEPVSRHEFLHRVRRTLGPDDRFLLGADLVKSPSVLVPAYDDAAGVTAAFNKNVLTVLNDALGADLDPGDFDHVALWDAEQEWIEMRLRARRSLQVSIPALDLSVGFAAGEELRTEISAKFRRERLEAELAAAGFAPSGWWTDGRGRFSVSLWAPV